jgi:outer membrane lipoprotein carrier protein
MGRKEKLRACLLAAAMALPAGAAWADGLQALQEFVKTVRSGRAEFTQTVTSPGKDGQMPRVKSSHGSFEFQRPERFRFIYKKPFEQTIVADGETLWLYDVDLNQVTARKQAQTLGSTPAALIASAPNLAAIEADFSLQNAPDRDGLQWVLATPKAKDGQLRSVAVGFRAQDKGAVLAALEILDSFGQRSTLSFAKLQINPALDPGLFKFTPPSGVDLIRP